MDTFARTHSENRLNVCLLCFKKGSSMQPIGNAALQRIRAHVLHGFDATDEQLPGALCARCTKLLADVDKGVKSADALPSAAEIVRDKTVTLNLLYLVLLIIWHTVAAVGLPTDALQDNEKFVIIGFAVLYVIAQIIICLQIVFGALKRTREIKEKDRRYEKAWGSQKNAADREAFL